MVYLLQPTVLKLLRVKYSLPWYWRVGCISVEIIDFFILENVTLRSKSELLEIVIITCDGSFYFILFKMRHYRVTQIKFSNFNMSDI